MYIGYTKNTVVATSRTGSVTVSPLTLQTQGEVYSRINRLKFLNTEAGDVPLKSGFGNGGHAIKIYRAIARQTVF